MADKKAIDKLIEELTRLPGIGVRTATRLAYHLLSRPKEDIEALIDALHGIMEEAKVCSICFNISESDPCPICADANRDHSTICVVEQPQDIAAIEATMAYDGVYHVLGGVLDALAGVDEEQLHIKELLARVSQGDVKEVILALNPTPEGETTIRYLAKILEPTGVKVTTLARGISAGSLLEFTDKKTLTNALANRIEVR